MSIRNLFIILFFTTAFMSVFSQTPKKDCICFDGNETYVKTQNKYSSNAQFRVFLKGYEKEEERKMAVEGHKKALFSTSYPIMFMDFFAVQEPGKIKSISEADCIDIINLNAFRDNNNDKTYSNSFFLIEKQADGSFLKWEANLRVIE